MLVPVAAGAESVGEPGAIGTDRGRVKGRRPWRRQSLPGDLLPIYRVARVEVLVVTHGLRNREPVLRKIAEGMLVALDHGLLVVPFDVS